MATRRRLGSQQRPGVRDADGRFEGERQAAAAEKEDEDEEEEEEEGESRAASPRSPRASAGGRMVALLCRARLGQRRLPHDQQAWAFFHCQ